MSWTTKSIIDTWKSDDGKVTIWTVSNGETEKKTMSAVISKIGWSGEIEEYQNAKGNKYIRQPAKEGYAVVGLDPHTTNKLFPKSPADVGEQLDRIEKKIDWLVKDASQRSEMAEEPPKAIDTSEFKPEDIPSEEEAF